MIRNAGVSINKILGNVVDTDSDWYWSIDNQSKVTTDVATDWQNSASFKWKVEQ